MALCRIRFELGHYWKTEMTLTEALNRAPADWIAELATPDQWERLPDTVYGLRAMLDDARSMRRRDVAILSDAFGFCRELLLRRPAEFGGPRECR
jgi:hypothetical protein